MNLQQFKKSNKQRRLKIALKEGFGTVEEYMKFLQAPQVVKSTSKAKKSSEVKPTIHVVDISDASGSMDSRGKYSSTVEGINSNLAGLKLDKRVNYTYTFVEFVQSHKVNTPFTLVPLESIKNIPFNGATGRDTPLYKTVYDTLVRLRPAIPATDKVLVKVYTDGINNAYSGYENVLSGLILDLENRGFTVTFVATKEDLPKILKDLKTVHESNTLSIENSGAGFTRAYAAGAGATMAYTDSVLRGESVKKGFYKKVGTL